VESILIRNLPEGTKARLSARAQANHRSMEMEARTILGAALDEEPRTIVDFLAHPESVDIDFEPEHLGAAARVAQL
jgi:plasmid stability protein